LACLPNILVDPNVFFEVVLNFVDNAIKYSTAPAGLRRSKVIIKAGQVGEAIVLSVGNRGIGIPEAERSRIFERYYRTAEARRSRPDGSGIGLSIVKDFATHYGYNMEVKSDPIGGTTDFLTRFEIHLKRRH
jgi:signal transduction histidine kinase